MSEAREAGSAADGPRLDERVDAARAWRARLVEIALPLAIFAAALGLWEAVVRLRQIPPYILPAPSVIAETLVKDWSVLSASLLVTLSITFEALIAATVGGVALAILLSQSKWIERAFLPFAIVLQVTPVIAIAPLLLVWLEPSTAVLVCAFLVAFFPVLANTALGLASTDYNLVDLFEIYRAPRWKQLVYLRLPSALPYFFSGLRIAGGLALIGAIVAELAAGAAGQGTGLAFRIVEAGFRLNIPRMFAALALISATGIAIYGFFTALSTMFLGRWHESAGGRER
ncbi:MAG: ABC transporter permease [Hyphomicrobiales bacterium]|nr:ABC transporter permease [Hyphomicrobiales bacterium]